MTLRQQIRFFFSWLASVLAMAIATSSSADELSLASSPLFLGTQVEPNVFFMLDDSGSMDWEILTSDYQFFYNYWLPFGFNEITNGYFFSFTSTVCGQSFRNFAYLYSTNVNTDNVYNFCGFAQLEASPEAIVYDWRVRSTDLNIMYYDPSATYAPWSGFPNANFNAARSNPQVGSAGYQLFRNLADFEYDVWIDDHGHTGATAQGNNNVTDGANGRIDLWDSHTTYRIRNGNLDVDLLTTANAATMQPLRNCNGSDAFAEPPYVGCFGTVRTFSVISGFAVDPWGRTFTQIQQNVANWYQYHRRRSFVAKGAIADVVSSNDFFRFGLSLINDSNVLFVEVPDEPVTDFDDHNTALLNTMFNYGWRGLGTPLRRGLELVGRYYEDFYAQYDDPIFSACQQNYSVLFTDGFWNGGAPLEAAIANEDGDGATDSLADVAHYFYNKDLSPLANDVPTTLLDPNDNQHMVSFTVAFGVEGNLVDSDGDFYPNPTLAENGAWSNGAVNTDAEKIDDVWHAAFNSKGYFVSAQSASGVADAISAALLEIADRVGSAASVATNSGSLNAGSQLFQARFDSGNWTGELIAIDINLDGTLASSSSWDASDRIGLQNYDSGREIITWNPNIDNPVGGEVEGKGIPFRFPADYTAPSASDEISTAQIAHLLTNAPFPVSTSVAGQIIANQAFGDNIADYLRGDQSNEGQLAQQFRPRTTVLGDIVHSDPRYVQAPNGRYADALEVKSYNAFKNANDGRTGVVYVGANDGMLHGFDGDNGNELIAYVPNAVYQNLDELATADYIHRYYVDAGANIIDVFLDDMDDPYSATDGMWRTVLAGGLGGGGQAIYALDVTDPSFFAENNADEIVLWEFDDGDDVDLGFTYGRPQMAKMADGDWAAVFGNGYNNTATDGNASTSGHAVLYIVDVETGNLLRKIDTEAGSLDTPNGLATPLMIDTDGDSDVDYIYAGDLLGNMWKFDVTNGNPANWDVAYEALGKPAPLFTTEANQQITTQPQAAFHPDNLGGFMIYFGTGKYLEAADNNSVGQTTQAFYGIWDKNEDVLTAFNSSDLLQQSISNQFAEASDTDGDQMNDTTFALRDVSDNAIDWATDMGWKLDLIPDLIEGGTNTNNFGERQISNAAVRNGKVIFTTLVPSTVECTFGGTSFLMQLDVRDGSALEFPAFDLNNDGEFNTLDSSASGRASDLGIMPSVSLLGDGAQDIAFGSGASGAIEVIQLSVGNQAFGRQSWRQLR
ncbi:MAG: PilC/PilY family type IV pilus protein [Pseudohongiellaceae bacterium]